MQLIPMVVDKNDTKGNWVRASEAHLFINREPIARTITCKCDGATSVHHTNLVCVAMRGRGMNNEQTLEPNTTGTTNAITTVQKDNLVMETEEPYRIRKLTPKECWRLMGFKDEDFDKVHAAGVSNSQLYKQAGNSIVKQVLMALFSQMNIKGVKKWNE